MCFISFWEKAGYGAHYDYGSQWSIPATPPCAYLSFNGRFLYKERKVLIEILYENQWSIFLKSYLLTNVLVNPICPSGL